MLSLYRTELASCLTDPLNDVRARTRQNQLFLEGAMIGLELSVEKHGSEEIEENARGH